MIKKSAYTPSVFVLIFATAWIMLAGLVAFLAMGETAAAGAIIYVDNYAAPGGDGSSWPGAFQTLQDGLAAANAGDEIWVAQGTYYPDEGAGQTDGDRSATFHLKNGVMIVGGFVGDELSKAERDPWNHVATLSGDIDQDDATGAHDLVQKPADIAGDNSFHVVTGSSTNNSAILDGFAITGGQANGNPAAHEHEGGGFFALGGSPVLERLSFTGNMAEEGGAMALVSASNPAISNARFTGNAAAYYGGALQIASSSPGLTNVLLSGNRAGSGGGAIINMTGNPQLTNVTIAGNAAGGTLPLASRNPQLIQAAASGGGIFNTGASKPTIRNSVIWNNADESGTGTASASIYNLDADSAPEADHSDIQQLAGISQLIADSSSFDQDPLFVVTLDPAGAPGTGGDLRLKGTSPAIDTADSSLNATASDLDEQPRIQGAHIDMGAFEAQPAPYLAMHKTADPRAAKEGELVTYTYQVINTGGIAVSNVTASDDLLGPIDFGAAQIAPGESISATLSHTVLPGDLIGPIANTAAVSGTVGTSTAVSASDMAEVSLSYRPAISVEVTTDVGITSPGNTVIYNYKAKNTGDVSLYFIKVSDSRFGPIALNTTILTPGATATGSRAYVAQNQDMDVGLINTAVVEGISVGGTTVGGQDSASVLVTGPAIIYPTYIPVVSAGQEAPLCQNLVENGGFEDDSAWLLETTMYTAVYSSAQKHSGARALHTGISDQADNIFSFSSGMQTVTIPAGATQADLSYYLWPQTSETTRFKDPVQLLDLEEKERQYFNDTQLVLILDSAGNQLARLYAQRRNDQAWILEEHDLLAFKGQTITLYFGTFNNGVPGQGVTAMFVDDVELNVCTAN